MRSSRPVRPPRPRRRCADSSNQVDERRNPRTNATLDQLLDRHFEMLDLEPNTVEATGSLRTTTSGVIGNQKVGALAGGVFDSFTPSSAGAAGAAEPLPTVADLAVTWTTHGVAKGLVDATRGSRGRCR